MVSNNRSYLRIIICCITCIDFVFNFGEKKSTLEFDKSISSLFNSTSTLHRLSNTKIRLISKCFLIIRTIFSMFHHIF